MINIEKAENLISRKDLKDLEMKKDYKSTYQYKQIIERILLNIKYNCIPAIVDNGFKEYSFSLNDTDVPNWLGRTLTHQSIMDGLNEVLKSKGFQIYMKQGKEGDDRTLYLSKIDYPKISG